MNRQSLKIIFAAAEAYPFAKVGGLADVGGSLPKALARLGHEVKLVLPGYPCVGTGEPITSCTIPMGRAELRVDVHGHGVRRGVDVYSIRSETYFDRPMIYGYEDDDVRFVLFSKAVVAFAALMKQDFGWDPDVIHCNDWHVGLAPQYLWEGPHRALLRDTATVLTIHNAVYQGHVSPGTEALIGLDGLRGSLLARGITCADELNTVSRRYRDEILTPAHGAGLENLLRSRDEALRGILNGVDYDEFDPAHDRLIVAPYGPSSLEGKSQNKAALQRRSDLPLHPEAPLLGMVARLVDQKGLNLLCEAIDDLVQLGAQVVVMGVGEDRYRGLLERAAARHPQAVAYHATDQEELARLIYAGSDHFLAPSAYEPCGLGPLIALRYGSIPVVRRTGGLAETIHDYVEDPTTGLGFGFIPKSHKHLASTVGEALRVYRRKDEWKRLQRRAMSADFSWEHSSREYELMYGQALSRRRAPASTTDVPDCRA